MPQIASVSVCVVRVPLDRVTSFATRTVKTRDYCLVKIQSTTGVEGIGFCYVGTGGGAIARVAVEELLAPILVGQYPTRIEGLWREMYGEVLLQGPSWQRNARDQCIGHRALGFECTDGSQSFI